MSMIRNVRHTIAWNSFAKDDLIASSKDGDIYTDVSKNIVYKFEKGKWVNLNEKIAPAKPKEDVVVIEEIKAEEEKEPDVVKIVKAPAKTTSSTTTKKTSTNKKEK